MDLDFYESSRSKTILSLALSLPFNLVVICVSVDLSMETWHLLDRLCVVKGRLGSVRPG